MVLHCSNCVVLPCHKRASAKFKAMKVMHSGGRDPKTRKLKKKIAQRIITFVFNMTYFMIQVNITVRSKKHKSILYINIYIHMYVYECQ